MRTKTTLLRAVIAIVVLGWMLCVSGRSLDPKTASAETASDYSLVPPFVTAGVPPLVMLVLGRDHKLYYNAYDDTSDLNGDGTLDVGYKPAIDYYGYFDSYKCYTYSSGNSRFEPNSLTVTDGTTRTKKCSGASEWSGDYLNYLTMSRMDTLRKVLYGGYRSTDTATETVLERVYIPQDAHTWGKEYESVARDGFDIREYTPLDLPPASPTQTRHLFASTTLSENGTPILRVLPNNIHRIWEWVAKERPVADSSLVSTGGNYDGYPNNNAEFNTLVAQFANATHLIGSGAPAGGNINGGGNPYSALQDYYLTVFTGQINIATAGTYQFAVDGDDAVEVIIDGNVVAGWYGGHGRCTCTTYSGSIVLSSGSHSVVFRHQERGGDDYYYLRWNGPDSGNAWQIVPAASFSNLVQSVYDVQTPSSTITDYAARVLVGVNSGSITPESNCKQYPSGVYKPTGILQKHGESNRMYFGLLTGSYDTNTAGGVLRKNISSITDEMDSNTGQFTAVNGIIKTINRLRTVGYRYSDYSYADNCGWITTRAINPAPSAGTPGECRMWGNPVAEMMYESLRYYSGAMTATSEYTHGGSTDDSTTLGLPTPAWNNPYDPANGGYDHCAKPFMLVISDISPSYDSDQLPGSYFGSVSSTLGSGADTLNVRTLANTISTQEVITGNYYIGQSGTTINSYCSSKNITGFGELRGLCPEEPTKQGSYYAASVAYYGRKTDISAATGDQNVVTYAVGLASPLPRIEIPVAGKTITLVPFGKSVGGYSINKAANQFQPTNTIVKMFVQSLTPTDGTFRINFEDVEQGADHDMDAIVVYNYHINADNTVTISLNSEYAAGSIIQHMGYIISGTTNDGTYLEVRDTDTAAGSDIDYYLDTPPGVNPNTTGTDVSRHAGQDLPLVATRTFTPNTSGATPPATLLTNPLWYAAKWGGYEDMDGDNIPDTPTQPAPPARIPSPEWDKDADGNPDTYFYVTNPLKLEEQLNKSFADILRRTSSGTAASVISSSRFGEGAVYQAVFYPEYRGGDGNTVNWAGELHSYLVDAHGNMREDTNLNHQLDVADDLFVVFDQFSIGTVHKYHDDNANSILEDSEKSDGTVGTMADIKFLWSTSDWLNNITDANIVDQRSPYMTADANRYIFTFIDGKAGAGDLNMLPDTDEVVAFVDSDTDISPYIHVYPPFQSAPWGLEPRRLECAASAADCGPFNDFLTHQSQRVIDYIRGKDQGQYTSSTTPSYTIPPFRNRVVGEGGVSPSKTWRLGDIVYSTPTVVGSPAEDLDLLYKDTSYSVFFLQYRNRRNVIYAGGNDGMLHAFNAGFYDSTGLHFWRAMNGATTPPTYSDSGPALGAELWGYVPYNLLPHLYWLTESAYNQNSHVAYVDLKPRIFDAKIFHDDATHPGGWGTVLVGGMRLGGGKIRADIDKTDGLNYNNGVDRTMGPAFFIMDITDPEQPPTLMAEISAEQLGFTTCYPTVVTMKSTSSATPNQWYLMLGSGPYMGPNTADYTSALNNASSNQSAKIVLLDLNELGTNHHIRSVADASPASNRTLENGIHFFAALDANSFISDPISVDFDLDYKTDVAYFGTVQGSFNADDYWGGKVRRVVFNDSADFSQWVNDSTLLDLTHLSGGSGPGEPIVAAPSAAMDSNGQRWVFVGTGRFFNRLDAAQVPASAHQQSYYGIKEPFVVSGLQKAFSWGAADRAKLLDVTNAQVFEGGNTVLGINEPSPDPYPLVPISNFDALKAHMNAIDTGTHSNVLDGWFLNFTTSKERNLGQATLLGDILTFTSYMPSVDPCVIEGSSDLYALYFSTGTAYKKAVFKGDIGLDINSSTTEPGGAVKFEVNKKTHLGQGLTITPNIHTGREEGSRVYVQTSTGTILELEEANPGMTKSGKTSWEEWRD